MLANAELQAEETSVSMNDSIGVGKLKKGIWQYLLDHSTINQVGNMVVSFYVKDKDNFWKRVSARANDIYSRVDADEFDERQRYIKARALEKGWADRMDVVEQEILLKGNTKDKLILWLYKKSVKYLKEYKR